PPIKLRLKLRLVRIENELTPAPGECCHENLILDGRNGPNVPAGDPRFRLGSRSGYPRTPTIERASSAGWWSTSPGPHRRGASLRDGEGRVWHPVQVSTHDEDSPLDSAKAQFHPTEAGYFPVTGQEAVAGNAAYWNATAEEYL